MVYDGNISKEVKINLTITDEDRMTNIAKFFPLICFLSIVTMFTGCMGKPKSSFTQERAINGTEDGGGFAAGPGDKGGDTAGSEDGGSEDGGSEDGGSEDGQDSGGGNGGGPPPVVDKSGLNSCADWNTFLGVNDPWACHVWHIAANNQTIKDLTRSSGNMRAKAKTKDLNVGKTYSEFNGEGVRIHISDTGFDYTHEDLKAHYSIDNSRNYRTSVTNPGNPVETGTHGTMCGGLAGAVGNNGIGLMGVAWGATMSGDNFLGNQGQGNRMYVDLYEKNNSDKDKLVNIWSGSFGVPYNSVAAHQSRTSSNSTALAAIHGATKNNILYFKANGNDGRSVGADGNMEAQASVYVINAIAALGTNNEVVNYSTPGSNVVLSGYAHLGGQTLGTCTTSPGDKYTCSMNGTSSATPTVAGAAGVIRQAFSIDNPSWTDLLYVMIRTANKGVLDRSGKYSGNIGSESRTSKVSTGFKNLEHSFDHGFGVVDVTAAVAMAKGYTEDMRIGNPASMDVSSEQNVSVSSGSCAEQVIEVSEDFQVWSMEVAVKTNSLAKSQLGIFLKTPNDKTILVKNIGEGSNGQLGYNQKFNVRAPLGLNAKGTWKVLACSNSDSGDFEGARVKIYGFNDINTLK